MTLPRVLYTDPAWLVDHGRVHAELAVPEREILDGVELVFGPHDGSKYGIDTSELLARAVGCAVIVIHRCHVSQQLLDAAGSGLRGVVRQGVGVDNLNAQLLAKRGIPAFNVPDYCVAEVVAHTAALALSLERQLVAQHQALSGGQFDSYAGGTPRRLTGRTLGIVGFGRIGRAVARQLGQFYGRVLVFDPYQGRDLAEGYGAHAVASLVELLRESHVVTLHCPLTSETEGLINAAALTNMRPDAYLINAARGKLVNPVALAGALAEGRIAGAGLDVFSPENPHEDERWRQVIVDPRVIVTSHRAFLSAEAEASSRRRVAETVRALINGEPVMIGRVDADGRG